MQWIENKQQMLDLVREIGFLPMSPSRIPGFSVFDRVDPAQARCEKENSPWEWRFTVPQEGDIAYGKFFGGKAGMITQE